VSWLWGPRSRFRSGRRESPARYIYLNKIKEKLKKNNNKNLYKNKKYKTII
jgi:hypothetical protein